MSYMFYNCKSLITLDIFDFNTQYQKEVSLSKIFKYCDNLKLENIKIRDKQLIKKVPSDCLIY